MKLHPNYIKGSPNYNNRPSNCKAWTTKLHETTPNYIILTPNCIKTASNYKPSPSQRNPSSSHRSPSLSQCNPSPSNCFPSPSQGNPSPSNRFPSPSQDNPSSSNRFPSTSQQNSAFLHRNSRILREKQVRTTKILMKQPKEGALIVGERDVLSIYIRARESDAHFNPLFWLLH